MEQAEIRQRMQALGAARQPLALLPDPPAEADREAPSAGPSWPGRSAGPAGRAIVSPDADARRTIARRV